MGVSGARIHHISILKIRNQTHSEAFSSVSSFPRVVTSHFMLFQASGRDSEGFCFPSHQLLSSSLLVSLENLVCHRRREDSGKPSLSLCPSPCFFSEGPQIQDILLPSSLCD